MSQPFKSYLAATRHPWVCALFVLPLLAAYEVGVAVLARTEPEVVRNGADIWLRWALAHAGLPQLFWPPAILTLLLLAWAWLRRRDRPPELASTLIGMVAESTLLATGLWGISRGLRPVLDHFGVPLAVAVDPATVHLVSFLGAGIYEEALFRLGLFCVLGWLFRQGEVPRWGAALLAATASALLFAAAHNLGPHGEEFEGAVFLFRTLAGLYFAALFAWRGFGVAVGAHAGYDVLVGVIVPSV